MLGIWYIPHNNIEDEHILSLVCKNHFEFHLSLSDDNLESLLVPKNNISGHLTQKKKKITF